MGVRCFIAVEIPLPIREVIGRTIQDLQQSGSDVKWVSTGNIHITLKFLGDTEESRIDDIRNALEKKLSHYQPFCIKITGAGSFPAGKYPRVVWVGVEESAALNLLQQDVEQEMAALGFPADGRRFMAHATVGRVKSSRRLAELANRLQGAGEVSFGHFEVRGISLMKSDLKPAGPEYTCLAVIPLINNITTL